MHTKNFTACNALSVQTLNFNCRQKKQNLSKPLRTLDYSVKQLLQLFTQITHLTKYTNNVQCRSAMSISSNKYHMRLWIVCSLMAANTIHNRYSTQITVHRFLKQLHSHGAGKPQNTEFIRHACSQMAKKLNIETHFSAYMYTTQYLFQPINIHIHKAMYIRPRTFWVQHAATRKGCSSRHIRIDRYMFVPQYVYSDNILIKHEISLL